MKKHGNISGLLCFIGVLTSIAPEDKAYRKMSFALILFFAAVKLSLGLLTSGSFGLHGDELFYMALADHLSWGYKEISPAIAFIAWLIDIFSGPDKTSVRLLPSLAGAGLIIFTGTIARKLGGGVFAVVLACTAVLFSPAFLATGYMLQPAVFDQLLWTLLALCFIEIIRNERPSYIYLAGLITGIGLLTKYSIALYLVSLLAATFAGAQKKLLLRKEWLVSALISVLIVLPNLLWQVSHSWPVLEHARELKTDPLSRVTRAGFILQTLQAQGVSILVWIPGLFFLLYYQHSRYQTFVYSFFILLLLLTGLNGKVYYAFGAFPVLFAAGGVYWEQKATGRLSFKAALLLPLLLSGLVSLPSVVPLLPLSSQLAYFKAMRDETGITFPLVWDDGEVHDLPEYYGSMLGWNEMLQKVFQVYQSIPPEDRSAVLIYAENYSQAGAMHTLGKAHNLAPVISRSSSFNYWWPPEISARYIIYIRPGKGVKRQFIYPGLQPVSTINKRHSKEEGTEIYLLPVQDKSLEEVLER